jgi:dynein heavy chain 1
MKKVSAKPNVLDLLQIENLHRLLERQDTTMATIQKALGEYLEKQRQIFPRFYFVNNDDLVEIIGNSNEQAKIFPYFSKMFAGLNSVETLNKTETSMLATALISREGETVPLLTPVDLSQGVKEWLNGLQIEMVFFFLLLLLLLLLLINHPNLSYPHYYYF